MNRNEAFRRMRRRVERGVTLIEVLIVVAIMSMISAGVVVAILPRFRQTQIENTKTNAREVRAAVMRWRTMNSGSDCPTLSQLQKDKEIDSASKTSDAWDMPYKIACEEDEVVVTSAGPDRREATDDDIRIPEAAKN